MTEEAPSFAAQLGGTALALVLVLALAWVALRGLRRLQQRAGGAADGASLQILRSVALSPRERVVAVRYRDREYLLGVSAGAVNLIDHWPAGEPMTRAD